MTNLPPTDDDPEDGRFDQAELDDLRRQAQALGIHYTGRDAVELQAFLALAHAKRGEDHPVACYGLSHEPTDRRCRICQLRGPCGDLDQRPRVAVIDPQRLEDVLCESCGTGQLSVELLAPDSVEGEAREIRDYGCTTTGCLNTLGIQCGWEPEVERAPAIAFAPKPSVRLEGIQEEPEEEEPEEEEPAAPEPKVPDPVPPKRKRPKLKIVKASKEKAPKEAPKEKAPKPRLSESAKREEPSPKPITIKEPKIPPPPKPRNPLVRGGGRTRAGVAFRFGGKVYKSLTAVATLVTGTNNWGGGKFFGCDVSQLTVGQLVEREWAGKLITVEVVLRG